MRSTNPTMNAALQRLKEQLRKAWCAQTAYQGQWDPENPALNQCAVTALVVERCLGGEIIQGVAITPEGERISHYWNRIADEDDTYIDLTACQFHKDTLFQQTPPRIGAHRSVSDYLLANPDTAARYSLLVERLGAAVAEAA